MFDVLPNFVPNFEGVDPRALDLWAWYHLVCSAGCVAWIGAYIAFAVRGFRDKTPPEPTVAICVNFGWEAMYLLLPNFNTWWPILNLGWLVIDLILLWQLFRYGPKQQKSAFLQRWFNVWVPLTIVLAFAGQLAFVISFQDKLGLIIAFGINVIDSALFVWVFFERQDQRGLSLVGAWLKMVGTLGTAIGAHVFLPLMNPHIQHWAFLTFMCVTIFVLDCTYIALLHAARRQRLRTLLARTTDYS